LNMTSKFAKQLEMLAKEKAHEITRICPTRVLN
jgi:hypothetical protein